MDPRDQNEEADALTNEEFGAFDPRLRVEVDAASIPWVVLPAMLEAAEQLYKGVQSAKEGKAPVEGRAPKSKKGEKLRTRDPW